MPPSAVARRDPDPAAPRGDADPSRVEEVTVLTFVLPGLAQYLQGRPVVAMVQGTGTLACLVAALAPGGGMAPLAGLGAITLWSLADGIFYQLRRRGRHAPARTTDGRADREADSMTNATVELRDVQTGLVVARIAEDHLRFLIDELEEEHRYDRDYHLDAATVDHLASRGADAELVAALRRALAGRASIEVEWSRRDR